MSHHKRKNARNKPGCSNKKGAQARRGKKVTKEQQVPETSMHEGELFPQGGARRETSYVGGGNASGKKGAEVV